MVQIDVITIHGNTVDCNLYAGGRCVKVYMSEQDYKALLRDGFFIRDGKSEDSAGVLNTSHVYSLDLK